MHTIVNVSVYTLPTLPMIVHVRVLVCKTRDCVTVLHVVLLCMCVSQNETPARGCKAHYIRTQSNPKRYSHSEPPRLEEYTLIYERGHGVLKKMSHKSHQRSCDPWKLSSYGECLFIILKSNLCNFFIYSL